MFAREWASITSSCHAGAAADPRSMDAAASSYKQQEQWLRRDLKD
jgi:hypothetical protein